MRTKPALYLALIVGALLVYEGVGLMNPAPGDTISEAVWYVNARTPLLVLFFGLLMGHFFWQRR